MLFLALFTYDNRYIALLCASYYSLKSSKNSYKIIL